ncbi:hypothetical protein [Paenibacillus tarimensis]|uniref:hypothetical protein n=1 Tax=Paenibacillus tarimensis TaxID=416012 RepID=UPI001F3993A1|nr:hypothetical protein [Paenibacillus tarimensis]MCF2942971.1 hypothetical protein [Paenibacillus tarimensis]
MWSGQAGCIRANAARCGSSRLFPVFRLHAVSVLSASFPRWKSVRKHSKAASGVEAAE